MNCVNCGEELMFYRYRCDTCKEVFCESCIYEEFDEDGNLEEHICFKCYEKRMRNKTKKRRSLKDV